MPSDRMRDLDALSHGLVLLQEICQGYDNPGYRSRALRFINQGADMYIRKYSLVSWAQNLMSTVDLIKVVERRLTSNA